MKRKIYYFLFIIFTATFLSGCEISDEHNKVNITEDKSTWQNNSNLFLMPSDAWNEAQASDLHIFQDNILTAYNTYDADLNVSNYNLKIVDAETGDIVYENSLSGLEVPEIQILNNKIAINDISTKKAYILDEKLNVLQEYEFDYNSFAFNQTATYAYTFSDDCGIQQIDLETNNTEVIYEKAASIYLSEINGDYASLTFIDTDTLLKTGGVLNLETGEFNRLSVDKAPISIEYTDSAYLAQLSFNPPCYLLEANEQLNMLYTEDTSTVILLNDTSHILVSSYDEDSNKILSVYDTDGAFLSSVKLEDIGAEQYYEPVWSEKYNGYFLNTMSDEDGNDRLLFWDITSETEGSALYLQEFNSQEIISDGNGVSSEYFQQAEEISEKYGVNVLIADQCRTEYSDHTGELLLNEEELAIALDTLDFAFSQYPEGFFEQLKHDSYTSIEIHVQGALAKDTSTEEVTYVSQAFVCYEDSKILLVMDGRGDYYEDINLILEQAIYHEVSHMIDRKLEFYSQYHADSSVYSEDGWCSLNPAGFEYSYDYNTCYDAFKPEYRAYFVDDYSCSFSTEDRARIMEYAAMGDTSVFEDNHALIEKLDYYSKSIRDAFDTTRWTDETIWEKTLNEVR